MPSSLALRLAIVVCSLGTTWSVRAQDASASALHEHAAVLDRDLARLQRNTRIYVAGWTLTNSALAGAQVAIALSANSDAVRSNYLVGAGLSAAGLLALLAQPWPGLRAYTRYRAMPASNLRELNAKVLRGESLLVSQMQRNTLAIGPLKHVIAASVALGSGIRAGMSFDSAPQGVGRALFVLFVLEAQILTHPGHYFMARSDRCVSVPSRSLTLAPWLDRHVQGARIAGRF